METFKTLSDIKAIAPPTTKDVLYVRHAEDKWFGVAILRARADGFVRRSYFVRLGQTRRRLGEVALGSVAPVGAIGFKDARKAAYAARAAYETEGAPSAVHSLASVWAIVRKKREKDVWSPDTLANYLRFIPPTLEEVERANAADDTIAPSRMYLLGVWHKRLPALKSDDLRECVEKARQEIVKRNAARKTPVEGYTGQATVASLGRFVNMLLAYAVNENWIRHNVMSPLVQDGLVQASAPRSVALQFDEIKPFWHWLHNHCYPAARDLILCAAFLGLRKSALGSMRWSDIESRGGRWHIKVRPNTRGNKRRQLVVLPIPDYLVEKVFEPRKAAPDRHEEWVIESPKRRGRPLHDIKGLLKGSLKERTGIVLSPHGLRRSGATWVYSATGGDLLLAKRWLTHSLQSGLDRDATTAGYLVTSTEQLRDAQNKAVKYVRDIVDGKSTSQDRETLEKGRNTEGIGKDAANGDVGDDESIDVEELLSQCA